MEKLYVVKIGGNVIDDENLLHSFLKEFAAIPGKKILVHGGGKVASELGKKLGIEPKMVDGRRITDAETLDVVVMVYAGLLNKKVVAQLQANSCDAIGLSGADGNCITAEKRKIKDIDYGFVGDILAEKINTEFFKNLLLKNITPVMSPIMHDGSGQLLNTNADTVASALAIALTKLYEVQLIYCFEKRGVLKDVDDENSLIAQITKSEYDVLKRDGVVSKGMIPKLDNAFDAIEKGVKSVVIGDAKFLKSMIEQNENAATKLVA
ncbi:MAG: acetylglutamate kinase [Bacteroidota bacterium]